MAWSVLLVVTLLEGLSGLGRTAAFSPFLNDLCRDLSLSRTKISAIYALAHLTTMFVLPSIGRLFDRTSFSKFLSIFTLLFGISFVGMSVLGIFGTTPQMSLIILWLGTFGIRMALHSYSIAGRSTIALWFSKKRGVAMGIYTLFTTLIGSAVPSIAYHLHQHFTWAGVWVSIGLLWLWMLLLCPFAAKPPPQNVPTVVLPSLPEKKATYQPTVFYFVMMTLFFKAFQNTGITLHLMPMCREFGADAGKVSFGFIPIAVVSITTTFIFGHFFRKITPATVLLLFLGADLGMLCAAKALAATVGVYGFILFTGLYYGLNNVVATLVLPVLFGVRKIGALHGWAYAFVSFGSSVGSFHFGWMSDRASYQTALSICMVAVFVLMLCLFCLWKSLRCHETV